MNAQHTQTLWDTMKAILTNKFIALNIYNKFGEISYWKFKASKQKKSHPKGVDDKKQTQG